MRPAQRIVARAGAVGRAFSETEWWRDLFLEPAPRAARYYARTWYDWLDRRPGSGGLPTPRPRPLVAAQAGIDETLLALFRLGRRPQPPDVFARIEAEAEEAIQLYGREGWLQDPLLFHATPPPLVEPRLVRARAGSLVYEHCTFDSEYEPYLDEPGRDRWLGYAANRTAHAWVLRHDEPRPWLVCIHGAGMGHPFVDLNAFRAGWLHRELGLNLAFPVLPLHGPRREGSPFGVGFPSDELLDTVHGVAQAVWDTRRLVTWIRAQGGEVVGLNGLSLGGYTTAVIAGVEPDLACVIVGVPAVDFAGLFARHAPARYRRRGDYDALSGLAHRVHHVVSPLAFTPRVPRHRRFIYAGLADRMVHPLQQVGTLWAHWDQPRILWFEGSHIGFRFSREVRAFVVEALVESGLVEEARVNSPHTARAG